MINEVRTIKRKLVYQSSDSLVAYLPLFITHNYMTHWLSGMFKEQKKRYEASYAQSILGKVQCPRCDRYVKEDEFAEIMCLKCDHLILDVWHTHRKNGDAIIHSYKMQFIGNKNVNKKNTFLLFS